MCCDAPCKANGGILGECCPLPTSATGLYKFLVQVLIVDLIYAVIQLASLTAATYGYLQLPGPVTLVGSILSLVILVYSVLITVIVCKSKDATWLKPMHSAILACVATNLVIEAGLFIVGIFTLISSYAPDDEAAGKINRQLRLLRFLPLVEVVCWLVCFCKIRPLAVSSSPSLKVEGEPAV